MKQLNDKNMEKFSAINIGPIFQTLGMARKPYELWAASYLFSHLMKLIYQVAEEENVTIISPSKPEKEIIEVGIFPDRIFFKGKCDLQGMISTAMEKLYKDLNGLDLSYFNLMTATCEDDKESSAIAQLNKKLDILELFNFAPDGDAEKTIYKVITRKGEESLLNKCIGKNYSLFQDLESISSIQLKTDKSVKKRSHHKYFCIVQADGDNVGKTISNKDLQDGNILKISQALVKYGSLSSKMIKDYGGFPVYAGGDDLLFIAPVIGKDGTNIFKLLQKLEEETFKEVHDLVKEYGLVDSEGKKIEASLSFGVSITYHKYPLYEALETARYLLFQRAKKVEQKKAVAWSLRKHSGGSFEALISRKNKELWNQFMNLIEATTDDDTVSAVAHKIRQEEALVKIVMDSNNQERLNALFDKVLEFKTEKENYFNAVKRIMTTLWKSCEKDYFNETLYSILRSAKFIKGEDLRDE